MDQLVMATILQQKLQPLVDVENDTAVSELANLSLEKPEYQTKLEIWIRAKWETIISLLEKQDRLQEVINLLHQRPSTLTIAVALDNLETWEDVLRQSTKKSAKKQHFPEIEISEYLAIRDKFMEYAVRDEFEDLSEKIKEIEAKGKSLEEELPSDLAAAVLSADISINIAPGDITNPFDTSLTSQPEEEVVKPIFFMSPKKSPQMLVMPKQKPTLSETNAQMNPKIPRSDPIPIPKRVMRNILR